MKKALFIDRDGTIIAEPADEQIDSLEKLAFVPGAISALNALTGLGFDLVLATNQDGLGTPSFPEDTFWPAHNKMLATLGGEGVAFDDQLIDRTFEADAAPTRNTTSRRATSSATARPTSCWPATSGRGASCSLPPPKGCGRWRKPAPPTPVR